MSTDARPQPNRLVVVGREEIVAPFRAAGLECVAVEPEHAAARVKQLISDGCAVIFYTADLAPSLEALVQAYSGSPEPSLVELPSGHPGGGASRIREVVRRAVGVDVLAAGPRAATTGSS